MNHQDSERLDSLVVEEEDESKKKTIYGGIRVNSLFTDHKILQSVLSCHHYFPRPLFSPP